MKSSKHTIVDLNEVVDFGKYQGLPLLEILEKDIEYAIWLSNNCKNAKIGKKIVKEYFNNIRPELKETYINKFL